MALSFTDKLASFVSGILLIKINRFFYEENINTSRLLDMKRTFTYTILDKRASDRLHSKDRHCLWQTVASNKLYFMEREWMVSDPAPDMFMSSLVVSLCISPTDYSQCSFNVNVFNSKQFLQLTFNCLGHRPFPDALPYNLPWNHKSNQFWNYKDYFLETLKILHMLDDHQSFCGMLLKWRRVWLMKMLSSVPLFQNAFPNEPECVESYQKLIKLEVEMILIIFWWNSAARTERCWDISWLGQLIGPGCQAWPESLTRWKYDSKLIHSPHV